MSHPRTRRPIPWALTATLLFAGSFAYFFAFQATTTFADPDSFYHVKIAQEIAEHGLVKEFPWLPLTTLADAYVDQHLLYHVFLIPFTLISSPIVGGKLATVVLAAAVVTAFAWILRRLHIRFWALWVAVLLMTNPFVFRMSLAKASAPALLLLVLGVWLLFAGRLRSLGVLAFVYVWSHGGFTLLLVVASFYALAGVIADLRSHRRWIPWRWLLDRAGHRTPAQIVFHSTAVRAWSAVAGGTLLGIVVNPYFPTNLTFLWQQLVQIGIVNYRSVIGVGGEWYPYAPLDLISNTVFVSITFLVGLALFALHARRQDRRSVTLLLTAVFFLALTLRSRRFVEYYVPFATLFGAYSITIATRGFHLRAFLRRLSDFYWQRRIVATFMAVYLAIAVPTIVVRDVVSNRNSFITGFPITKFEHAMTWLRENSEPGSFVLHSDWDEFPILFYHNDQNVYTAGLDATFFYVQNPERYWDWVHITSGSGVDDLLATLQNDFHARYVFLETDHTAMDSLMRATPELTPVYADDEAHIYEVPRP